MQKKLFMLILLILLAGFVLSSAADAAEKYKGYARGEIFITAQELNQLMQAKDPKLVVIAVASKTEYYSGHIPGSFHLWRPDYEADPKTQGGVTDNLIEPEGYTRLMQKIGVDPDSKVVVYDHKYDATRLWWAFYYYGKTDVRILDGGIKAWTRAGYATDLVTAGKAARPGTWVAKVTYPPMRTDTPEILALKDRTDAQLWDVREDKESCGNSIKEGAFRAGRIPWGVQADYVLVKIKENHSEWRPAAEVQKTMEKLGFDPNKQQYLLSIGSPLHELDLHPLCPGMAMEKLHNYDGSWIAWSKDEKLPIEKGCPDTTPAPWQKK
jgi:thiosulfate/3-mercaptopyruvate sulfurtransferase